MDDLMYLDATAQAELVRNGELQAIDLVDAAIERIEKLNPSLNAVIATFFERAREQAVAVSTAAPFAGVPFLLKDIVAEYEGTPICEGSAFLA